MNYFIFTLGCQMNISDSQRIAAKLNELGHQSASIYEADLVIVNSCSVRQKGVDRIWGRIKKWQEAKKTVFITGCILEADRKHFARKNITTFNINDLPNIEKIIKNAKHSQKQFGDLDYFEIKPFYEGEIAYIPIGTGCDNFCTYCAVPYTRGREVSRSMNDILNDVKDALKKGFKEIWLLGQNVNSYGKTSPLSFLTGRSPGSGILKYDNSKFIELLNKVDKIEGDFKFNFISSNPHDMSDELIETFSNLKKWTKELHLAMQSGDDEILKKMNRKYTSAQYLNLISKLKSQIPDLKLSTDIIVGFCGESDEQFENTVKVCKSVGFWKAFIAQYSPRKGTVSAKTMKDDVPAEVKKQRWEILNDLINKKEA